MGLDQYLYLRRYISQWDSDDEQDVHSALALAPDGLQVIPDSGISISYPIGYWRKSNAIHAWFVENVQDGEDDCRTYYFDKTTLSELRSLCLQLLSASNGVSLVEIGGDLLPPKPGPLFESSDFDADYVASLKQTIDVIDAALSVAEDCNWKIDFAYTSSW